MTTSIWQPVAPRQGLVDYPPVVDAHRGKVDSGPVIKDAPVADESRLWLKQNPFSSVTELADGRGISLSRAVSHLARLLSRKRVVKHDRPLCREGANSKYFYTACPDE